MAESPKHQWQYDNDTNDGKPWTDADLIALKDGGAEGLGLLNPETRHDRPNRHAAANIPVCSTYGDLPRLGPSDL
jgi:hypothetical protein